jgi:hypothetical protein
MPPQQSCIMAYRMPSTQQQHQPKTNGQHVTDTATLAAFGAAGADLGGGQAGDSTNQKATHSMKLQLVALLYCTVQQQHQPQKQPTACNFNWWHCCIVLSRSSTNHKSNPQHATSTGGTAVLAAFGAAGADLGGGQAGDGSCAYYYCECTQQLNSQYGDLQHKIQDLEV